MNQIPHQYDMRSSSDTLLNRTGVISAIILISCLCYEFIWHEGEEVSFSVDEESMMNDIDQITSFGPRVSGSESENLASQYISQRFTEIGLVNVEVIEYDFLSSWFVDAEPDEHQILMHAQLEQGAQNIPGLPDGTAGTARIAVDETGDLNHMEAFTYLGYSGSNHKHDNMLTFLGNGSEQTFADAGDLTDLAVMIELDGSRSLADIYRDSIDGNAGVVMVYTVGVENPPFKSVTVIEEGNTVPFPEAYGGQYSDLLIPYIYISEAVANTFHDYIEQASSDPLLHASLDGFWEGNNVGTRKLKIVKGEVQGSADGEILVGAHHDSVYTSPGAVDNAVGVSHLIEVASHMVDMKPESTVTFITWGGEELGMLGSQKFLQENSGYTDEIDLYINLDSTNLDPSIGLGTLGIETSEQDLLELIERVRKSTLGDTKWSEYTAGVSLNDHSVNSDHRSFNKHDIDTIAFFGWEYGEYHRNSDVPSIVNREGLGLTVEIALHVILDRGGYQINSEPLLQVPGFEGESESWVFPFIIALLAGLATGIGGLIVFIMREITPEFMAFLLAMAAGVMLLVSVADLWFKQALEFGFMSITGFFVIGMATVYAVSLYNSRDEENQELSREKKLYKSGILTAIALAIHNFPEGLAIGVAVLESAQYGLVLMAAIALHNIPEGIAVAAPIKAGGGGRLKATLIAMGTGMTEPLGAIFALLVLGPVLSPFMVGSSLAFVGGIMTVVAYKELIPQAWAQERPRHMIVGAIFGAAVMQVSLILLG